MKILSSLANPHVISSLYDFITSMVHKKIINK